MTTTDITVNPLKNVSSEDANYLVSLVRTIPGFPNPKIVFRDFLPVFADARGMNILIESLVDSLPVSKDSFDLVAGLEARGFLFGPVLAARLNKGFVAVRKAGKLPPEVISESYSLEYGEAKIEIEKDSIKPGQRVLIVDDLIATGGTAKAAARLVERSEGVVAGFCFVMELTGINGMSDLQSYKCSSLMNMPA
ncbi:adenine phosphoribosyltransferase [Gardnerella sp. DNF01144]|uniref:adenine phosphoribosyltransferase n=1 Tax=Gardnerella sp. DNF01144 TaxID=2749058 RepID=UPI000353ABEF|nr:adenine phosphoribosyltransferase [Gardnerella vaginalis JCP8522]EPI45510.1 adenine phosphoribosyltransferase [Gardnerella vaginalis JCP8151B]